jgi:hypothetical protein
MKGMWLCTESTIEKLEWLVNSGNSTLKVRNLTARQKKPVLWFILLIYINLDKREG